LLLDDVSASLWGKCYEEKAVYKWVKRFSEEKDSVTVKER